MSPEERNEKIVQYLPLCYKVAGILYRAVPSVSFEEYLSGAHEGLIKAIDRFDPEKGSLSTYTWHYVFGYARQVRRTRGVLSRRAYEQGCQAYYVDGNGAENGIDEIPDKERDISSELRYLIRNTIAEFPEKKQKMFLMYYFNEKTYEEIGQNFKVSKQAIQQALVPVIKKVKQNLIANDYGDCK